MDLYQYPKKKRNKFIDLYMDIAERISYMSVAERLKVGALIVKDGRIISMGWNGTPPGWENSCEIHNADGSLTTKPEVVHAEMNCILKVAKSNDNCQNADLILTHSPCSECAKLVLSSGIRSVVYKHQYRNDLGIKMLRKGGIKVSQHNDKK